MPKGLKVMWTAEMVRVMWTAKTWVVTSVCRYGKADAGNASTGKASGGGSGAKGSGGMQNRGEWRKPHFFFTISQQLYLATPSCSLSGSEDTD